MTKERIIELRGAINEHVFLHERLGSTSSGSSPPRAPTIPETDWLVTRSPSELVEHGVDLGASPRAIICWGRLAKVWALLVRRPDRGLSRGHPGPRAVHPQPPHLARPARGREPRADAADSGHQGHHRAGARYHRTENPRRSVEALREPASRDVEPFVNLSELTEIELLIMQADARVHDRRAPEPSSTAPGFDFVGLRDWQAGDRLSQIDWAAVDAHQFQPAGRPRVRAAEHGGRRRRRGRARSRRAAASTACRSPRRSPARSARSACRPCSSRTCSA